MIFGIYRICIMVILNLNMHTQLISGVIGQIFNMRGFIYFPAFVRRDCTDVQAGVSLGIKLTDVISTKVSFTYISMKMHIIKRTLFGSCLRKSL